MSTTTGKIQYITDENNGIVLPVTHERGVVDSSGVNLETKLAAKQATISTVNVSVDNNTGTPSGTASVSGDTMSISFSNLKGGKGDTGATPAFSVGTVSTLPEGSQATVSITGTTDSPVLNIGIPTGATGAQGNTGSSIDYPYELINNLTTNDATKGLSAAQGVTLKGQIDQLGLEVDEQLSINVPILESGRRAYSILATGKYGTSTNYVHAAVPVTAGKKYVITAVGTSGTRYCFLASLAAPVSGGNIDLVAGTSPVDMTTGQTVVVTIPSGCVALGFHLGSTTNYTYWPQLAEVTTAEEINDNYGQSLPAKFDLSDIGNKPAGAFVLKYAVKAGESYTVQMDFDTTAIAQISAFYSCDETGLTRTNLRNNLNSGTIYTFLAATDLSYFTFYITGATGTSDLKISFAKVGTLSWSHIIGVDGGNLPYYGDAAISLNVGTKRYMGRATTFYSQNYDSASVIHRNQSMAIFGSKAFLFQDSSLPSVQSSSQQVAIFDLSAKTFIAYAANPIQAHCNNAQFTDIYYDENDAFPLVMLSNGDYPEQNAPVFHFIRIVESNGTYTLTVVKTITCTIPAALNNGSWVANFRQKRLWMYTFTLGPYYELEDTGNKFALYEFDLPDMSNWNNVTLTQNDVKRYSVFDYCVMQGATEVGGLLYMPVQNFTKVNGLPFSGSNAIWVINPDLGRVVNVIPFTGPEPEGIGLYNGKLYISQKNGSADETTELAFQIQEFDFGPES